MENIVVGEGLQPGAFTRGEVAERSIRPGQHVLAAGHPVHAGLERLGRLVERASGVAGVGSRARLKPVIGEGRRLFGREFRVGQVADGVAHGAPRQRWRRLAEPFAKGRHARRRAALARGDAVAVPIVAPWPLREGQRLDRMGRRGKLPLDAEIGAEADEKHPLALLRHAIIRRVENLRRQHVVFGRVTGVPPLQAGEVIAPVLVGAALHAWMLQLQMDVVAIGREARAHQPLDVLEDEGARHRFPDDAHRLRPHIAIVEEGAVLAAQREGLAGRAARHEVDRASMVGEGQGPDIALDGRRPMRQRACLAGAVLADRVATPAVPFDDRRWLEARPAHAHGEAAGAGEKFDRDHAESRRNRAIRLRMRSILPN